MKIDIEENIEVPEKVAVKKENHTFIFEGPAGKVEREIFHPKIDIGIKNKNIFLKSKKATKREKKMLYTYRAHLKNCMKGALEPFMYKLKICSSHFPMKVSVRNNTFSVSNLLGEKYPRELKIINGVEVSIEEEHVIIKSNNIETAGRMASNIEQLTRIKKKDPRIIQDGIYIVEKAGKSLL